MLSPSAATAIDSLIHSATINPHSPEGLPRLVVIAATSKEIIYTGTGGYAQLPPFEKNEKKMKESLDQAKKISENSIFELFSATKLITVIAATQLMEKGVWKFESDASEWVPELKTIKQLTGWTDGGEPILVDNDTVVTIEMLINHTAGFTYGFDEAGNHARWVKYANVVSASDPKATRESITKMPLMFKPGTHWQYGMNNDWLCLAIEGATGMRLSEYFNKNIFGPLGISDIKQTQDLPHINMARETADPDGHYDVDEGYTMSKTQDFGGHGLKGSPASYIKVLQAIISGGGPLLKPETAKMMFEPHISQDETVQKDLGNGTWDGQSPFTRKLGGAVEGGQWGLGGVISGRDWPHGRSKGSMTWSGMANVYWVMDPKKDLAFILFSNMTPYGTRRMFDWWEKIEIELYKGLQK